MKVWYAVIQYTGCDSGETTVHAQGVFSDREKAKRAIFENAVKHKHIFDHYTYEDVEWRDEQTFSCIEMVYGRKVLCEFECTEIELDAAMQH